MVGAACVFAAVVLMPLPLGAALDRDDLNRVGRGLALEGGDAPPRISVPGAFVLTADAVVPPVKRVVPKTPDVPAEGPPAPQPAPSAGSSHPVGTGKASSDGWPAAPLGVVDRVEDWLARANREFQSTVIRRLSTPPASSTVDEIARKLEEVKRQDAEVAAAAMRAGEALKAAQAKQAEEARRRAEDERRAAADVKRQEEAGKAVEEAKVLEPPPQAQPPASPRPDESARLAEDMRKERARLEAEAQRIEEQRQAAEAQRKADERRRLDEENAKAEAQRTEEMQADERRRAAAEEAEKNRTRTIVLTTEPIPRSDTDGQPERLSSSPSGRGLEQDLRSAVQRPHFYRQTAYRLARGPAVRRWIWRVHGGQCRFAGRRILLPGRYTVARGDSLWLISARHYRTGRLSWRIYRANRSIIRDPDRIYPCQRLFLPRRHR